MGLMSVIKFETALFDINGWTILHLPKEASTKLPSRGQVMVKGTITSKGKSHDLQTALEPDGNWSHWFRIDDGMKKTIDVTTGDTVAMAIESTKDWPEPTIPEELKPALADPQIQPLWERVTPMARWEWIRWISATAQTETRKRRIEVMCSKLLAGERRPCCFNRSMCCVPEVSKNGVLLESNKAL
jgi:hypothetical protein